MLALVPRFGFCNVRPKSVLIDLDAMRKRPILGNPFLRNVIYKPIIYHFCRYLFVPSWRGQVPASAYSLIAENL